MCRNDHAWRLLELRFLCSCRHATSSSVPPITHHTCRCPLGIPTLVLTDASGPELAAEAEEGRQWGETWQHYPNMSRLPTSKPADPRAAVVPATGGTGCCCARQRQLRVAHHWGR